MTRPLALTPREVHPPRATRSQREVSLAGTMEGAVDMARIRGGYTHETLGARLGYSRAGVTMFQTRKRLWNYRALVDLMRVTGDLGPLQWMAAQIGAQVSADPREQRRAKLRAELQQLDQEDAV